MLPDTPLEATDSQNVLRTYKANLPDAACFNAEYNGYLGTSADKLDRSDFSKHRIRCCKKLSRHFVSQYLSLVKDICCNTGSDRYKRIFFSTMKRVKSIAQSWVQADRQLSLWWHPVVSGQLHRGTWWKLSALSRPKVPFGCPKMSFSKCLCRPATSLELPHNIKRTQA